MAQNHPANPLPNPSGFGYTYLELTNYSPAIWCAEVDDKHRLIGRSRRVEIQIPSQFTHVSRQHAVIWSSRKDVWLMDLKSTFGTRVNGVCLKPNEPQRVFPGDRIRLGNLEVHLTMSESQRQPTLPIDSDKFIDPADDRTEGAHNSRGAIAGEYIRTLSPTELEILLWLCRGYTVDEEIAQVLCRSPNTVRTHLAHIFEKIGVHSRAELVGRLRRDELFLEQISDQRADA